MVDISLVFSRVPPTLKRDKNHSHRDVPVKNLKANYIIITLLCAASLAHADPIEDANVRAVLTVGALGAMTNTLTTGSSFPVVNPETDSFYYYDDTSSSESLWGFNVFIGGEWPINPMMSIQVGLDYVKTAQINVEGTVTQGADVQSESSFPFHYEILVQQALLEGKLLFNVNKLYHPYLLLGLGAAFNQSKDFDADVPECLTLTRHYEDNVTSNFSYAIGAGMDIDLLDHLRFGFSYRYTGLGEAELGNSTLNGEEVDGRLTQDTMSFSEVLLQLSWVF
jgi:opacity protein-like surface antigen